MKTSRRVVGVVAGVLTGAPVPALACPVCGFVGTSSNTWAYQAMTAMLILLPLAMVGATVWWLARLAARADAERSSVTPRAVNHEPAGVESARWWGEPAASRPLGGSPDRPGVSHVPRGV